MLILCWLYGQLKYSLIINNCKKTNKQLCPVTHTQIDVSSESDSCLGCSVVAIIGQSFKCVALPFPAVFLFTFPALQTLQRRFTPRLFQHGLSRAYIIWTGLTQSYIPVWPINMLSQNGKCNFFYKPLIFMAWCINTALFIMFK